MTLLQHFTFHQTLMIHLLTLVSEVYSVSSRKISQLSMIHGLNRMQTWNLCLIKWRSMLTGNNSINTVCVWLEYNTGHRNSQNRYSSCSSCSIIKTRKNTDLKNVLVLHQKPLIGAIPYYRNFKFVRVWSLGRYFYNMFIVKTVWNCDFL